MRYCLFPFFDQYQLLKHRSLLDGNINYIITLNSWYDRINSLPEKLNGVELLPYNQQSIQFYDTLIVLPHNMPNADKNIWDFVMMNLANNKTVCNYHIFSNNIPKNCKRIPYFNTPLRNKISSNINLENYTLHSINASVIYNTSIIGGDYHTDIELFLYKRLKEMGANVCVVSACQIADLYGFIPFPLNDFKNISLYQAVAWINNFFHELEQKMKPDVFLISMPEELISHEAEKGSIGILNYICTNTVIPDYTILNILLDNYTNEILNEIISLVTHKINNGIDSVVISDILFDMVSYSDNIKPSYEFFRGSILEQALICDKLNKEMYNGGYIYNNNKIEDYERLYKSILSKITRGHRANRYERVL